MEGIKMEEMRARQKDDDGKCDALEMEENDER